MSPDHIFISSGNRFHKLNLEDLLYIETADQSTIIVTTQGKITTSVDITLIEKNLPASLCCHVQRDCLVSLQQIISFDQHTVHLPGIELPLSRKYCSLLKERIKLMDAETDFFCDKSMAIDKDGRLTC